MSRTSRHISEAALRAALSPPLDEAEHEPTDSHPRIVTTRVRHKHGQGCYASCHLDPGAAGTSCTGRRRGSFQVERARQLWHLYIASVSPNDGAPNPTNDPAHPRN